MTTKTKSIKEVLDLIRHIFLFGLLVVVGLLVIPRQASAIPVFSREYSQPCSTCHSPAPPRLNDFGRKFKEAGYYLPGGKEFSPSDMLSINEMPPFAFRVKSWLVQKKSKAGEPTKFTIPDEYELFFANAFGPEFSVFGEVEWEHGESEPGATYLDWHSRGGHWSVRAGNFSVGDWLQPAVGSGHFRLTRQKYLFEEQTLDGAQNLGGDTPGFMIYGRPSEPFWIDAAVVEGDTANKHKDFWAHVAYAVSTSLLVDAFTYMGKVGGSSEDFSRFGVAARVPVKDVTFNGLWTSQTFSHAGTPPLLTVPAQTSPGAPDAEFTIFMLGLTYPFSERTYGEARWENITSSNVSPKVDKSLTTLHVGYLIKLNVRTALEYTTDSEESDNNRFTWIMDVAL